MKLSFMKAVCTYKISDKISYASYKWSNKTDHQYNLNIILFYVSYTNQTISNAKFLPIKVLIVSNF